MRKLAVLLTFGALAAGAILPGATPAATTAQSSWASDANKVCVVWLAKAKKEFGSPVTPAQLYGFAVKAKTLESQELAVLAKVPRRTAAGTHALAAVSADISEVDSAISAWKAGKPALFVQVLKAYLNDNRAKAAFAAAGATKCG